MGINLEAQEKKISTKSSLINKFCIATLKSKLDLKNKQYFDEITIDEEKIQAKKEAEREAERQS